MERSILHNRLVSYARWKAASQGYRFGRGAEGHLDNITDQAITRMFGNRVPKRLTRRHEIKIVQAEAALSLLVATMIEGRRAIKGYAADHPDEIGERTMDFALTRLCPIFPIC